MSIGKLSSTIGGCCWMWYIGGAEFPLALGSWGWMYTTWYLGCWPPGVTPPTEVGGCCWTPAPPPWLTTIPVAAETVGGPPPTCGGPAVWWIWWTACWWMPRGTNWGGCWGWPGLDGGWGGGCCILVVTVKVASTSRNRGPSFRAQRLC